MALSRQMKLSTDEREESLEKDCCAEVEKSNLVPGSEKDCGLSEIKQNSCTRDTGQEGSASEDGNVCYSQSSSIAHARYV